MKRTLNAEQCLCAARIFLNILGLTIENNQFVSETSKTKIFDKNENQVGEVYFDNGKVRMAANYDNNVLEASFDVPEMTLFDDEGKFAMWSNEINFQCQTKQNLKFTGNIQLDCSVHEEDGLICKCHPEVKCEIPKKGTISLDVMNRGSIFKAEIDYGEEFFEIIDVRPWDELNGYVKHKIVIGEYDKEKHGFPYSKGTGILNGPAVGENQNELIVFSVEEEYDNKKCLRNEFIPKEGPAYSREILMQTGMLMHQLDPDMFEKIKGLNSTFTIGGVSILENLISVCYDIFNQEEVRVLVGVERKPMTYQDGSDNLTSSYFGIGYNNCFSPDVQKRLLER